MTVHSSVKKTPAAAYGTLPATLVSSAPRATEIPTQMAVTVAKETAASKGYGLVSAKAPVSSASAPSITGSLSRENSTGCAV